MSAALAAPLVEGAQTPRVFSAPPAAAYHSADEALDFAVAIGIVLDPWQRLAVRTALAEAADGRWAAFEFALFVARQNGKGEVIMVLELAKLFLFRFDRPPLILHSAHLFPTAQEAFRRIRGVIDGCDMLRKEVKRVSASHGGEGIELRDGARLRFMARTISGAGRGFSPTDLYFDEVFRLPAEAVAANLPALSAQPNPQIGYFASVGYPDSDVQWRLVERGRAGGDPTLAYMEFSPPDGADLDDIDTLLAANPAVGYRISLDTIQRERLTLTDEDFARERASMWADSSLDRLIDPARWAELEVETQVKPAVFGVCGSLDGAISIVSVGADDDGLPVLDLIHHRAGTAGVVDLCQRLDKELQPSVWVLDEASPVFWMAKDLQDAGLYLHLLKAAEVSAAAAQLVDAVAEGIVRHGAGFDDAVRGVRERGFRDGGFFFGRRASDVDISPLTAAAPALWAWMVYGEGLSPGDVTVAF